MADFEKQVKYWKEEADSSWDTAQYLLQGGRTDFGLFAAHLAVEQAVKAHVVRATSDFPPRIHNLLSLAQIASLTLSPEHERTMAELNIFNIRGRYRDTPVKRVSAEEAQAIFSRAKEVFQWLMKQL